MKDHLEIKTKIDFVSYNDYINYPLLVNMIVHEKHAVIIGTISGEKIAQYINDRYGIPIHSSEQKLFRSVEGFALRRTLSESISQQFNQM